MAYPIERLQEIQRAYQEHGAHMPGGDLYEGPLLDLMLMCREFMKNKVVSEREAEWLMTEFPVSRIERMNERQKSDFLDMGSAMAMAAARFVRVPKTRNKLVAYALVLENLRADNHGYEPTDTFEP